jgi:predicted Zn-dependent peptidase
VPKGSTFYEPKGRDMKLKRRGVLAALFLSALAASVVAARTPVEAVGLAPGETVLPDGLTTVVRHATGSGAVAVEVWIRCPADGWSGSQPGIARLTALSTIAAKSGGANLRDIVQALGGQLQVSVFQTATEIAVVAPAPSAWAVQDELIRHIFYPLLDVNAFDDARTHLAAEQAAVGQSTLETLRDQVFASLFASGPMHDSTYGDAASLKAVTLVEVRDFAARSYVSANAAVVTLGDVDATALTGRLSAAALPQSSPSLIPLSPTQSAPVQPIAVASTMADVPGVALAWTGPPISDQRAATAMDFLSDYLADASAGVFAKAVDRATAGATLSGQFVTLENPGIFYVTVSGDGVDPAAMQQTLRDALAPVLRGSLPRDTFAAALAAYETRLLRQMDSAQGLADNYGWYFAQEAPAYAPSATDAAMSGPYFANAASLTPDFVRDVARKYLGDTPTAITLMPSKPPIKTTTGG